VDQLSRPFVQLWDWVERVGGFPGQMLFICAVIMLFIGVVTWFTNAKGG
jgi:hypothetical protein